MSHILVTSFIYYLQNVIACNTEYTSSTVRFYESAESMKKLFTVICQLYSWFTT